MNDSPTWYATPSDTAVAAPAVTEPPRRRFAIAAGSALLVLGLGLAIAGTVDANSGTDSASSAAGDAIGRTIVDGGRFRTVSSTDGAATGRGCDRSNDGSGGSGGTDGQTPSTEPSPSTDPSTSPDPANA